MAALFLLSALPVSTRSLPALVGATTSTIPLHYVALRCTSFQPYCVCRPLFFQRLLIRPAIGVCSVITLHWNKERCRWFVFFPRRYTLASLQPRKKGFSVCGGCSRPQHRVALLGIVPWKTPQSLRCFGVLVEPHSSVATGLRSFFQKIAKGALSEIRLFALWQSSKKIELTIKDSQPKQEINGKFREYLQW